MKGKIQFANAKMIIAKIHKLNSKILLGAEFIISDSRKIYLFIITRLFKL